MVEWKPFWTDEVIIEKGGRYPLLLNRFHDHLEDYLIKGIVSVTDRLRYISYCCWIIGDIQNNIKPERYPDFVEAFRRREGALAIGTRLLEPKTVMGNYTTYGRDVMRGVVEEVNCDYKTSFKILPSNELGAYGQYYKGTMQNWGLTFVNEDGIVQLTDLGFKLYLIMDSIYEDSEYYKNHKGENEVPGKVLIKWAELNEYDNITDDLHINERKFYREVIFHLDTKSVIDGRRDTFAMYLECIEKLETSNCIFNEEYLNDIFFYLKYEGVNKNIINFNFSIDVENTRFIWEIYEMHAHFRWWISEYFRMFLRLLLGSSEGLTIEEVFNCINIEEFNDLIFDYTNIEKNYYEMNFGAFLDYMNEVYNTDEFLWESWLTFNSREGEIYGFSQVAAGLIMMIALFNKRYEHIKIDSRYINVKMKLSEDYSFSSVLDICEGLQGKSILEVLELLLRQFVIRQHNSAMYEKHDLRRCWFTVSGEKYLYQADASSIWRPAKHNIICNFLFDMGLAVPTEDSFVLSDEGKEFYKFLKDEYYEK